MVTVELPFTEDGPARLDDAVKTLGLRGRCLEMQTLHDALHWHITKPGSKGTVEATWDPATHRFWLNLRPNRASEWTASALKSLAEAL